MHVYLA